MPAGKHEVEYNSWYKKNFFVLYFPLKEGPQVVSFGPCRHWVWSFQSSLKDNSCGRNEAVWTVGLYFLIQTDYALEEGWFMSTGVQLGRNKFWCSRAQQDNYSWQQLIEYFTLSRREDSKCSRHKEMVNVWGNKYTNYTLYMCIKMSHCISQKLSGGRNFISMLRNQDTDKRGQDIMGAWKSAYCLDSNQSVPNKDLKVIFTLLKILFT